MPLALKYKLLGSAIFVVGANSTAVPFVWKSKGEEFRSLLKENVSTTSNNENEILKSSPQEDKLKFQQINSDHLKLNDSKEINISANTINIQVNNSEVLLIDSSGNEREIKQQFNDVTRNVKKITREVKRENNISKINEKQEEIIKKAIKELETKKQHYEQAFKKTKEYYDEKIKGAQSSICIIAQEKEYKLCYGDRSSKVTELNKEHKIALKEFLKSYIDLHENMINLQNKLNKSIRSNSEEVKKNEFKGEKENIEKILKNLKEINWDKEKTLFKGKDKSLASSFGWKEKWEDNPFNALFDTEIEWEIHMRRIIEAKKEKNNKNNLNNVFYEMNLLIATNLLKKMGQLKIEESR
ncbi:hypothetical protein [Mycoplasma parvum]|uniref:Uncharacterized protein n=1 Tax=Mycoplasma parvum str. Indiana TaxID=1403316 RepID=U5NBU8_9MOLU|nr:hypothetical protein [Mycoplasma parvum]AGX88857.1 hypothetical protein PRV_00410 [Mycoplasma parvum str. Indiana]